MVAIDTFHYCHLHPSVASCQVAIRPLVEIIEVLLKYCSDQLH